MAQIEQDVVVKIRGGEVVFDEPGFNDWALIEAAMSKEDSSQDDRVNLILPKIREVRGLEHRDGTPVTKEEIVQRKLDSKFFYLTLFRGWIDELNKFHQNGNASGNEPTPA